MINMGKNYRKNPYELLNDGFADVSPASTDSVRIILFQKEISRGIKVRIRFTLYISDVPDGKYSQNHQFHFEEISLNTTADESGYVGIKSTLLNEVYRISKNL